MWNRVLVGCLGAVLLAGCGSKAVTPQGQPGGGGTVLPGGNGDGTGSGSGSGSGGNGASGGKVAMDEQGGNAGPGLCGLFSRTEIGGFVGTEVGDGQVTGPLRSACTWESGDHGTSVMITMVLPSFYPTLTAGAEGYRELDGIGDQAHAGKDQIAGMAAETVRTGVDMIKVSVDGRDNGLDVAVNLLRETVRRTGGDTPIGAGPHVDGEGGGAGIGLCKLFTADEIAKYLGAPAKDGKVTGTRDSACTWKASGSSAYLTIEMHLAADFNPPTAAPQYRELTGLGDRAYAAAYDLNLWNAVALRSGRDMTRVVVHSPLTIDDAITVLTEVLSRTH